MTRGSKSSEKKACYDAFYVGVALSVVGIYAGTDVTALAALIVAVSAPLMWYAGARTMHKRVNGEKE